jgi:hypothetical protein
MPVFADESGRMATKSKQTNDAARIDWEGARRWAGLAGWTAGLGAVALILGVWVPKLVERTRQATLPAPMHVVLRDQPSWLPKEDRRAIERAVVKSVSTDPFDQAGLQAAREAVQQCGWYEQVTQLRRTDVDEVVVEGRWAVPFALVCDAQGEHLVDTKGRLLPRDYAAGKGPRLLRIQGATGTRPAGFGTAWPGAEVDAALRMAALVQDREWRTQIAAVDLSGFAKDGLIRLRTDRGREIVWGRAPGEEGASEVPAAQKLAALQYAFERFKRIDAGAEHVIDLRGDIAVAR